MVYSFSENRVQMSFITDYLTTIRIFLNYMPFKTMIGATCKVFEVEHEEFPRPAIFS